MEKFWAWWALIFYILPLFIALPLIRMRRREVNSLLTGVALKYDGTIRSMVGIPYYVGFDIDGTAVSLSLSHRRRNSPPITLFSVELAMAPEWEMVITQEDAVSRLGKRLGKSDIEVTRPEFDDKFNVRGSDEPRVRSYLQPAVQDILLKWHGCDVVLEFRERHLRFVIYKMIKEDDRLDEFISDGAALLKAFRALG